MGVIVIMFALGFEEDTNYFVSSVKKSAGIAFFGALAPFLVAYCVARYFYGDPNMSHDEHCVRTALHIGY